MRDDAGPPPDAPVAYLTGSYPRVSHTFILREVAGLRALGHRVLTCSIRRSDPAALPGEEEREEARTTFVVLDRARVPWLLAADHLALLRVRPRKYLEALALALRTRPPGARALLWQMFYFAEAVVLARHLARHGVRHIHNHFGDSSGTVAMLASVLSGIPFSVTMHGPTIFFEPHRWRFDEKIARAAFTVCISHFCRSQAMILSDPAHWPKLRIVRCGVDAALYDRPRVVAEGPGGRLLFVGRLARVKGVPVLLEALARVREAHPGTVLTLVGDGPERRALEARAAELGLTGAVVFAGSRSQREVAEHLARADVFVLPSFAEGVPVVLMEAMAARVPVVATRIAGVPELVEDGASGFLVPPGEPRALAERISRLLADPALGRRMGEMGRLRVLAEYDVAGAARRIAALLDEAGTCPPPARQPLPPVRRGGGVRD